MPKAAALLPVAAALLAASPLAAAFTIQFDYTYDTGNFFASGSQARDRLLDAGAFFEGLIADDLDAIVPSGSENWTASFEDPSNEGTPITLSPNAFPPTFIPNPPPPVPADTIIVYVGADTLSNDALGKAAPAGIVAWNPAGGSWESTLFTRGEAGATTGSSATDFAPWGGSLSVDSDRSWDFSLDGSGLTATNYHFYSLLLHEMMHVLGVGTSDSWQADLGAGTFVGAESVAVNGGPISLTADDGHWIEGTNSVIWGTSTAQETAMDPTLNANTVKLLTELDVAALRDIGWQTVPEPSPALLGATAVLLLLLRRRSRR